MAKPRRTFLFVLFISQCSSVLLGAGPELVARAPNGCGLLGRLEGKRVLIVSGTPEEMGTAHGQLLKDEVKLTMQRVIYLVGAASTVESGKWFFDDMAEIERRTSPHLPQRFLAECDAMAAAAGVSQRDGRYGNLFPEKFHCSGVAVRGKASVDGRVVHARVLDYMRDIGLQETAVVGVFLPKDHHAWMTLGYAGFIGTVTAMNEKGLAVGEMGGRGEGKWDGMPMSFLLREIMERAATVDEALEILETTPRTCEYYYVLSDRSKNLAGVKATPEKLLVLRPGEQHPELPPVPEDVVYFSAGDRAKALSERLHEAYGKIDVARMIEVIKRPVAMSSNLHDAIFLPESLDMWVADAGRDTVACDEPYVHVNLAELKEFYSANRAAP
ncbi:MAG: peptidase C45 [Planctomycetaceae bacterium]|mgnify:CR=1 FL=1|nr:peptidase C45 [Planctomycetaceae bacterium]